MNINEKSYNSPPPPFLINFSLSFLLFTFKMVLSCDKFLKVKRNNSMKSLNVKQ